MSYTIFMTQFLDHREKQKSAASGFEQSGSLEMAYIASWSTLEFAMKEVASVATRNKLRLQLMSWMSYLDKITSDRPAEIKSFAIQYTSDRIPNMSLVEQELGQLPALSEVMDTNKKYRKKRNNIAHHAEPFIKVDKYQDYKAAITDALSELQDAIAKKASTQPPIPNNYTPSISQ